MHASGRLSSETRSSYRSSQRLFLSSYETFCEIAQIKGYPSKGQARLRSILLGMCALTEEENYQQAAPTGNVCRPRHKFQSLKRGTGLDRDQHCVGNKKEMENGDKTACGVRGQAVTFR